MPELILLPQPRHVQREAGPVLLPLNGCIVAGPGLLFEAQALQTAFARVGRSYPITAAAAPGAFAVRLHGLAGGAPESYRLAIAPDGIVIAGADPAGVWYGVCTLRQIVGQAAPDLPALTITDAPDFPQRGVMLDVSRDRVPRMDMLYALVERLASWKINHLELYAEHTFAYPSHPAVWRDASPFTPQEIIELGAFCRQRHITLVPNQNSLGHMERWLKHSRYAPLAEKPEGFTTPWDGRHRAPSSLNPLDPGSIELVAALYDELLPHFTADVLNVGGDEPWELGEGRSAPERERIGLGRLYLNYLLKLYAEVTKRGKTMLMWDDIIVQYPELIPELPHDVIAMIWGYEANHPFEARCQAFLDSGIPFYVCPGTSSWNTVTGRWDNMTGNQLNAAENGLKYGARGILNTDWGDNGHWQAPVFSLPGFAYGAALAWGVESNRSLNLTAALDALVFEDRAGEMGRLMRSVGRLYQYPGQARPNGHLLMDLLRAPTDLLPEALERWTDHGGTAESLQNMLDELDACSAALARAQMACHDAALIRQEVALALDWVRHAARQALLGLNALDTDWYALAEEQAALIARQRSAWLARSRPGGLEDSISKFALRA